MSSNVTLRYEWRITSQKTQVINSSLFFLSSQVTPSDPKWMYSPVFPQNKCIMNADLTGKSSGSLFLSSWICVSGIVINSTGIQITAGCWMIRARLFATYSLGSVMSCASKFSSLDGKQILSANKSSPRERKGFTMFYHIHLYPRKISHVYLVSHHRDWLWKNNLFRP